MTKASDSVLDEIECALASEGLVILHLGQVPSNPVNLFDVLVVKGSRVLVEVDDAFLTVLRRREALCERRAST